MLQNIPYSGIWKKNLFDNKKIKSKQTTWWEKIRDEKKTLKWILKNYSVIQDKVHKLALANTEMKLWTQ